MNAPSCQSGCVHTAGAAHCRWCSTPTLAKEAKNTRCSCGAGPEQSGSLTGSPKTTWHLLNVTAQFSQTFQLWQLLMVPVLLSPVGSCRR